MNADGRWEFALQVGREALERAIACGGPIPQDLWTIAASADASGLHGLVARIVEDSTWAEDDRSRGARALLRAGVRAPCWTPGPGRPSLALAAEHAARGEAGARAWLVAALDGPWAADAAGWLARLGGRTALDALARRLELPGPVGLAAASALLAFDDDAAAFVALCGRACDEGEALEAARALWGAAPNGRRLGEAMTWLAGWARRGVARACVGGRAVALVGAARGLGAYDAAWVQGASDNWRLEGARAAWWAGRSGEAHGLARALCGRAAWGAGLGATLVAWAEAGDGAARGMVVAALRAGVTARGLWRAAAATEEPRIAACVDGGLRSADPVVRTRAAEGVARARMAPSVVPPVWV